MNQLHIRNDDTVVDLSQLKEYFTMLFEQPAAQGYFCPGRVNLIGEHIDYNGGLVLPCAITMGTYLLLAPNQLGVFRFRSINFEEEANLTVLESYRKTGNEWYNYPLGVINQLMSEGHQLTGLDMLFYGNLPVGAGLSSSASIEMVTAFALNDYFQLFYSRLGLVKLTQTVENHFIGVSSGIMDQFAVGFGLKNKAMLLNCSSLVYETVEANLEPYMLVIINTNKPRRLAESKYNERVSECQAALDALQPGKAADELCEFSVHEFESLQHLISDVTIKKRALHVIAENERVKLAKKVLSDGDLETFGQLMYQSHNSLRDLYEVSGKELDTVVEYSRHYKGVIGSRMTGAGFGGCAIALVRSDVYEHYSADISDYYQKEIGYVPSVYVTSIGQGVGWIDLEDLDTN